MGYNGILGGFYLKFLKKYDNLYTIIEYKDTLINDSDKKMTQAFNVIIEKDADGYFVASVPSLKGCHTQAKSYDELIERIQEAIELCLEMEKEEFEP